MSSSGQSATRKPPASINDPDHWRKLAENMRKLANGMKDGGHKRTLLRIAQDIEGIARMAEERAHGEPH